MSGQDRLGPYGFEALGGPVTDDGPHVTVTFWHADTDRPAYAELSIEGGDDNFATAKLTLAECRRLRNVLAQAERRLG
jgi:hypothetical protein